MNEKYCAVPNDLMQKILDNLQRQEYRTVAGILLEWNARHVPNVEVQEQKEEADGEAVSD